MPLVFVVTVFFFYQLPVNQRKVINLAHVPFPVLIIWDLPTTTLGGTPFDPISAEVQMSAQWAQSSFSVNCKISVTLWCTNCFHCALLFIQQSTVFESGQYLQPSILTCWLNALDTISIKVDNMRAAISRSLGIDDSLKGATLDFPQVRLEYIISLISYTR